MTDELKQKLRAVIEAMPGDSHVFFEATDDAIEQITQAFVADGWVKEKRYYLVPPLGSDGEISLISQQELDKARGEAVPVMTGQQYASAFDNHFRVIDFPYKTESERQLIITITKAAYDAAKKAAGIES